MTTDSFRTPNTQRKWRRWSDSQMDWPFVHLPTTDFLSLMFLDSQRNQKCGSLPGYLNGKDPFNSQAGDEIHCVAFIALNLVSSSKNIFFSIELGRKGGWWSLGGQMFQELDHHRLQRNRLDARILTLRPLATLGKSLVVEVFHTI